MSATTLSLTTELGTPMLTGENSRWENKERNKALWREGWRNLHSEKPTEIEVDLVIAEEQGPTTVRMSWADDASFDVRA